MSQMNGSVPVGAPPPYDVVRKGDDVVVEAGPLPVKVPLQDDVVIASPEALPSKAETSDPWASISSDLEGGDTTPWSELSCLVKIWRVTWVTLRIALVFVFLYLFIVALDIMGSAFQLISGRTAGSVMSNSALFNNMISAMMIGVLVTVLLQSSSSTTSIIVTMVGANMLTVKQAIPVIMGANIGTSVTSTIVSLTQSSDRDTFRRSFAGATVHDMFNWLTVLVLLPIEAATHMLYHLTSAMVQNINPPTDTNNPQFLNVITEPFVSKIIDIDRSVIVAIAKDTDRQTFPLPEFYCKEVDDHFSAFFPSGATNQSFIDTVKETQFAYNINLTEYANGSAILTWLEVNHDNSTLCTHLYAGVGTEFGSLSELTGGVILLVFSLVMMVVCLLLLVKILNSLIRGPAAKITQRMINAKFPGKLAWLTGYASILVGAGLTFLVQSSSVFTSTMTPLVGLGIVTVNRMYPLTLGANIGTTFTSLLAAFTAEPETIQNAIQVSLCHLFFNIFGICMFYPIPFMRHLPIKAARFLGNTTAKYRWFAVAYLIVVFAFFPAIVFGLSLAGVYVLIGVLIPIALLIVVIVVVKVMQSRCPAKLPSKLQSWKFLPQGCRSLKPYDTCITVCCKQKCCQKCCTSCGEDSSANDVLYIVSDEVLDPRSPNHVPISELVTPTTETQTQEGNDISLVSNGQVNAAYVIDYEDNQTRL